MISTINASLQTCNSTIPNVVVIPSIHVKSGHVIYADTNGRFFTKCLFVGCENPDCVLRTVMDT